MQRYTFHKEERLCHVRLINSLFGNGSSFVVHPFRLVFLRQDFDPSRPVQVVISVPKRRFKKAVNRNRLKRLMREAYRLEKPVGLLPFLHEKNVSILLALQYIGGEEQPLAVLREKLLKAFGKLKNEIISS